MVLDNLQTIVSLGYVKLEDVDKLRGCYLLTEEDPAVFIEPKTPVEQSTATPTKKTCQSMLDQDYLRFCFDPAYLLEPFKKDNKKSKTELTNKQRQACFGWTIGRDKRIAGELF